MSKSLKIQLAVMFTILLFAVPLQGLLEEPPSLIEVRSAVVWFCWTPVGLALMIVGTIVGIGYAVFRVGPSFSIDTK